jgi:hypothetical protein
MSQASSESENNSSKKPSEPGSACHLLACWFLAELTYSTLKMEAMCPSETSVDTQRTTRRYIPEDRTIHNHCCENLKSYTEFRQFFHSKQRVNLYTLDVLYVGWWGLGFSWLWRFVLLYCDSWYCVIFRQRKCSSGPLVSTPTRLYKRYHNPCEVTVLRIVILICTTLGRTQVCEWQ